MLIGTSLKLGFCLPHRDWETKALSFLEIIFRRKEAEGRFTTKRGRERLSNGIFSKKMNARGRRL